MFRQIEDIQHEIDYGDYEAIQEGVSITYATESAWTGGYNGSITIVNNTNRNLTDWKLLFDSEAKISGGWSAQLVDSTNDTYSVMGYNWNRTIAPGQSAKVSFTALGNKPMETGNYVFLIKKNKSNKGDIDCRFEKGTSWGNGCTGEIVMRAIMR